MSGIGKAIENLAREAPGYIEETLPIIRDLIKTVLIPILVVVISLAGLVRILEILYRILNPPGAEALHKEALGVLKKGDGDSTWEQAEKLFRKSVRKDPHYLPSYLSLIAMQLYRKEDHEAALLTIKKARAMFPTKRKNKELRDMELDARAMGSNLGHMVLAGSFASPYLGGAYKPAKTPKPPFAY